MVALGGIVDGHLLHVVQAIHCADRRAGECCGVRRWIENPWIPGLSGAFHIAVDVVDQRTTRGWAGCRIGPVDHDLEFRNIGGNGYRVSRRASLCNAAGEELAVRNEFHTPFDVHSAVAVNEVRTGVANVVCGVLYDGFEQPAVGFLSVHILVRLKQHRHSARYARTGHGGA